MATLKVVMGVLQWLSMHFCGVAVPLDLYVPYDAAQNRIDP